ncbi:geranylgeranyl reductase family protein [bacterium]|nr:geranylgeranyl reductase family protein [bacterium]
MSTHESEWDAIVVGGGPAGTNAAIAIAKQGFRVAMIDWRPFPREKVCGDGLIADSLHHLKTIGLYDEITAMAQPISTLSIYGPSRGRVDVTTECFTIKRIDLDARLHRAAIDSGAVAMTGKVTRIDILPDGRGTIHWLDDRAPLSARYIVVATGADNTLLRAHDMVQIVKPDAVAVRGYLRSSVTMNELLLSFDRPLLPGYTWIFPMGEGVYNIGCGVYPDYKKGKTPPDPRVALTAFMAEFPIAKQLAENGEWLAPVKGSVLRCGLRGVTPVKGPIVAAGETIATTFPFTGEGIGKAMETGAMAGELVARSLKEGISHTAEYIQYLHQLKHKYRGYDIANRWISYPFMLDWLVRQAQKRPRVRHAIARVLSEEIDLVKSLSVRNLLKLIFH